jgi:hypothetical protein
MKRVLDLQQTQRVEPTAAAEGAWSTASLAKCGTVEASTFSVEFCGGIPKLY